MNDNDYRRVVSDRLGLLKRLSGISRRQIPEVQDPMNQGPHSAAWFAPIADQIGEVRTHSWVISKITVSQEANLALDVDDVHVRDSDTFRAVSSWFV